MKMPRFGHNVRIGAYFRGMSCSLQRTENAVAGVAETRQDIAFFVELVIDGAAV